MARFFLNRFTCFSNYYQIVINFSLPPVCFWKVTFGEEVVDLFFSVNTIGPPTTRLLETLTAMRNTNSDFTVTLVGDEEMSEGFADPPADIVDYAIQHNINLNLRSVTVQRVIRVRMSQEEPNEEEDR